MPKPPLPFPPVPAQLMRDYLRENRLSGAKFARKFGVPYNTVRTFVDGRSKGSFGYAEKVMDILTAWKKGGNE